MGKLIDLTGKRFGKLTVIKKSDYYISPKGLKDMQWECECDCGNTVNVRGSQLRSGMTKSCGCLQKELASSSNKKYNTYNLDGNYGIGYTSKGEEFYFDLDDYDRIKNYCWFFNCGYVSTHMNKNGKRVMVSMHRFIMGCENNNLYVDHIHGSNTKNDNRKSNLRIATPNQNTMNHGVSQNNKSGATGVFWYKYNNKWRAYISVNNRRINLGYFENFDDAVAARKAAEEKYFGEWSYDNSQAS